MAASRDSPSLYILWQQDNRHLQVSNWGSHNRILVRWTLDKHRSTQEDATIPAKETRDRNHDILEHVRRMSNNRQHVPRLLTPMQCPVGPDLLWAHAAS